MSQSYKETMPIDINVDDTTSLGSWSRSSYETLKIAQQVLEQETASIEVLKESLGLGFVHIIDKLMTIKGRIVITGIGKSGHIARKIASTLASTGTPSFFIHPSEASHGDLGMMTDMDAVIVLSNSGESKELCDIIAYTRRFAIFQVAITSKLDSMLARAADDVLCLPNRPEALSDRVCSNDLLDDDARSRGCTGNQTLLQLKGFTVDDFATLHPGGSLGRTLIKVEQIMHGSESLPLVTENALMSEVIVTHVPEGIRLCWGGQ